MITPPLAAMAPILLVIYVLGGILLVIDVLGGTLLVIDGLGRRNFDCYRWTRRNSGVLRNVSV